MPDDGIYGQWVTFPKKKVKWLKLCPNGVDTSLIPEPEEAEEEDMFSFGDALGEEEEGCPLPGEETEEQVADASGDAPPPGPAPLIEHRVSWPLVAAGTGLLVGGGTALAIASSRKAAFLDTTFTSSARSTQLPNRSTMWRGWAPVSPCWAGAYVSLP